MEVMGALQPSAWGEPGNKMKSFSCRPCCASPKVMVKCCHMLKARHLPSPLLFDLTKLLFNHWPLTWHLTWNNRDLISIYIFICGSCRLNSVVIVYTRWYQPNHPVTFTLSMVWILCNAASGLATLLTFLLIILPIGCCPATTCTSVFNDAFKLSSR